MFNPWPLPSQPVTTPSHFQGRIVTMPLEVSGSPGDFPTIAPFSKVGWFEQKPPGKKKVCLVREAKGTTVFLKIPENQRQKIKCGKQHFKAIGFKDGEYDWVASASDV